MFAFSVFADPSERKLFVRKKEQAEKHMNLKLVVVFYLFLKYIQSKISVLP